MILTYVVVYRFDYLLISHFLLNLQDLSTVTTNDSDRSRPSFVRSNLSSIRFNRVLGNIGAPLYPPGTSVLDEDDHRELQGDQMAETYKNNDVLQVDSESNGLKISDHADEGSGA